MAGEIRGLQNGPPQATTARTNGPRAGSGPASADSLTPGGIDKAIFTDTAVSLQKLEQFIGQLPIENAARVGNIREMVAGGLYRIDDARVADKFVEFELLYHQARVNDGFQASA